MLTYFADMYNYVDIGIHDKFNLIISYIATNLFHFNNE